MTPRQAVGHISVSTMTRTEVEPGNQRTLKGAMAIFGSCASFFMQISRAFRLFCDLP
jgi:hypothetical protein